MAAHSSTLAWKIPWTEENGRPVGSQRVGYDSATSLHLTVWGQCPVSPACVPLRYPSRVADVVGGLMLQHPLFTLFTERFSSYISTKTTCYHSSSVEDVIYI